MKSSERLLIGVVLCMLGMYIVPVFLVMPTWNSVTQTQQTITTTEEQIPVVDTDIARLNAEISRLRKLDNVPEHIKVRKAEGNKTQQEVKAMLDDLVTLANHYNNDLITLQPFNVTPPAPPTPPATDPAPGGEEAATAPEPAPVPATQAFGYDITIRGTYPAIEQFIAVLSTHPELVEIQSITFQNEGGQLREQVINGELPTNKPMRASLKLVLYLS